ncbi:polyprenol monophosphomannose synthase [Candidatus Peregrinibacteria bacterium]|nr:polyprenol monophosphomannose synthase [Candidatus Peregrinibacteria bacterium]MBI3816642.1 polyprenol monophosphomannose synthase [Candidatus Peregrinibacteria bacterium]
MPHEIRLVSVILPTYDERENIVPLLEAIHREIRFPHEIIVVDDNSPDGTSKAVSDFIRDHHASFVRLETRLSDRGLTKSIRRGIEFAKGDTVVWMDCDFSMPPEKIPELLAKVEQGIAIAVGSRFVAGGSTKDFDAGGGKRESALVILLSRFLNWLTRMTLIPSFHDYTSGFIAVRREVLDAVPLRGDYGEYFMDLMVRAILQGFSFVEIPYTCVPRRAGETKTGGSLRMIVRRGIKYLSVLGRLWMLKLGMLCWRGKGR